MSITSVFASAKEAKAAGWFSRRHQMRDAHNAAQDRWRIGRELKREREQEQAACTRARKEVFE